MEVKQASRISKKVVMFTVGAVAAASIVGSLIFTSNASKLKYDDFLSIQVQKDTIGSIKKKFGDTYKKIEYHNNGNYYVVWSDKTSNVSVQFDNSNKVVSKKQEGLKNIVTAKESDMQFVKQGQTLNVIEEIIGKGTLVNDSIPEEGNGHDVNRTYYWNLEKGGRVSITFEVAKSFKGEEDKYIATKIQ